MASSWPSTSGRSSRLRGSQWWGWGGEVTVAEVKKKERLTLELPQETKVQLQELQGLMRAASMSETIRIALSLCEKLYREREAGSAVVIHTTAGRERELVLP